MFHLGIYPISARSGRMLTVLTICALAALSCTDEDLTAPRAAQPTVSVNTLIVADTLCTKMQFTITSATAVTTAFPNRTTCSTTGMVLIRGQAATWAQSPNRRLTLFVRLLNKSGQTLQLPVRLYLPTTGTTVVAPAGTPASKVVPLTPDSVDAGGGKIWFIGGTGTLAANDSTVQDTIKVNVMSPVTQARFQFQATANTAGGLPPVPATVNWPVVNPLLTTSPWDTTYKYYRNILGVEFDSSVTATAYNNVVSKYSGTLIGGMGRGTANPYYFMQFPDPGPSYGAMDSLTVRIRAEPHVVNVLHIDFAGGFRVKGRYPNDSGISSGRTDWSGTGTTKTWPWLAVRAPLAWGCEMGKYGSAPPKVAIADAFFDVLPTDLAVPAAKIFKPGLGTLTTDPGFASGITLEHGAAVASIFGSTGDNGIGLTGMIWAPNLELYAFGIGQQRAASGVTRLVEVVDSAISRSIRIVSFSFGVGEIKDTTARKSVKEAFARYLASGPDRLLILATGDSRPSGASGLTGSLTALSTSTNTLLDASDGVAAELLLDPLYRGKILLVTGTVQGGLSRLESHVWTGTDSTIIAAPAKGVYSLNPSGVPTSYDGTSFAVPFVTGTAAMLWTMDSTLTAKEVVGYIIEGAKSSRVDPVTGGPITPTNIGYAGVYQLDTYGALRRLSNERGTAPICGLELQLDGNARRVTLQRNTPTSFPVDSNSGGLSVAQGGRIVAVGANYPSNTTKVYGQTGVLVSTVPNVWSREYLEKDTVDYFYDFTFGGINSMSLRRQNGTASFFKLDSLAEPGRFGANILNARVSPDGAWVATRGRFSLINGPICVPVGTPAQAVRPYARTHLIRLADGASQLLRSDELYSLPCVPINNAAIDWSDVPVWRPDAAHFLLLVAIAQFNGGTLTGWNDLTLEQTAAAPTTIVGSGSQSGLWHSEGGLPADGSYLRSLSSAFNGGNFLSVSVMQRPVAPFMVVSQIAQRWPWQLVPLRRGGESVSGVQRPRVLLQDSHGPFDRLMPGGPTRIIAN